MVTNLTQLGYVNNYDKNRYLEKFYEAAVHITQNIPCRNEKQLIG